jgi:hypothetical protein
MEWVYFIGPMDVLMKVGGIEGKCMVLVKYLVDYNERLRVCGVVFHRTAVLMMEGLTLAFGTGVKEKAKLKQRKSFSNFMPK